MYYHTFKYESDTIIIASGIKWYGNKEILDTLGDYLVNINRFELFDKMEHVSTNYDESTRVICHLGGDQSINIGVNNKEDI